jgi:NAD(P)-dependent dehydrogenase (short-subunit alcohol dehydrogenase family)
MSEALAAEVRPFGIKVLIVEPGAFRTELFDSGRAGVSRDLGVYVRTVGETRRMVSEGDGGQSGDPAKAAALILAALDAQDTPLRLPLGDDAVTGVLGHLEQVRGDVVGWEKRARATGFDDA